MLTKEIQQALEADGEKLRQLTGEDHGPVFLGEPPQEIIICEVCDGAGITVHRVTVYEHGCGFPHDDTDERRCEHCSGLGYFVEDATGDTQ